MISLSIRFDISLKNFKKPLDSFSPQLERERSKEYLVITLAVKESFERFSCLEFIFKKANTGKPAYKMKNINKDFQRHFNTCLREWKLLSLYMFHRIIFLLLIVSSLSCNFNRCADCFQSFSDSLLYWSLTVLMFIQTLATASTAKVRTGWPYRWFWKFF